MRGLASTRTLVGLAVALAGCSSRESGDRASLSTLDFHVPSGWTMHDQSVTTRTTADVVAQWTPGDGNDRKESITIVRTERPHLAKQPPSELETTLVAAQRSLPGARFASPTSFATRQGLAGFRVEGDFVPRGQTVRYHRIHAAIIDGNTIIHVLYTARDPEPEHFEIVVSDLSCRKGASS